MGGAPRNLDHLVYATLDLVATVDEMEQRLGTRAVGGGRHSAWATHNALLGLGSSAYLELVAPDPSAPAPAAPRPFELDRLRAPRLVTWVVRDHDLEGRVEAARQAGLDLGTIASRSRQRPDGTILSWRMTDPLAARLDGLAPFFIDWGDTPHPAASAPPAGSVDELRAEHPDAERVGAILKAIGIELNVTPGLAPALIARIATSRGPVELR